MIHFGVWAPDEATFWQSWIEAGIVEVVDGQRRYKQPFAGYIDTTSSWSGIVVKENIIIPGWHTNVRVWGRIEEIFTRGLPQFKEVELPGRVIKQRLRKIWQRTNAQQYFNLVNNNTRDKTTRFPAGKKSSISNVKYADMSDFSSPSNVWA